MQEEMSDSEMWKAVKEQRQKQHSEWKELNTDTISKSGIPYRLGGREALLFRESGKPKVDFYPSTGRWRVAGDNKTYSGGAKSFLQWYSGK